MDSIHPRDRVRYLSLLVEAGYQDIADEYRRERYTKYVDAGYNMSEAADQAFKDVMERWPVYKLLDASAERQAAYDYEQHLLKTSERRKERKTVRAMAKKRKEKIDEKERLEGWESEFQECDVSDYDLPTEIAWALHNLGKIPDTSDEGSWSIFPADAPSPGAWHMLIYAADNKKDFMKTVMSEQMKMRQERLKGRIVGKEEADEQADSGGGKEVLEALTKLLEGE